MLNRYAPPMHTGCYQIYSNLQEVLVITTTKQEMVGGDEASGEGE